MVSILNRTQESSAILSSTQMQMNQTLGNFVEQASDAKLVVPMLLGGFSCRLGKMAILGSASKLPAFLREIPFLVRGSAALFGLASEVTAFRASNTFLRRETGGIFDADGWLGTFTDFLALKTMGHLGAGQNLMVTHMAQSNAMVLGHELSARLGFTTHERGSYLERLVHAQITNIQMSLGMAMVHHLSQGRILAHERAFDLTAKSMETQFAGFSRTFFPPLSSPQFFTTTGFSFPSQTLRERSARDLNSLSTQTEDPREPALGAALSPEGQAAPKPESEEISLTLQKRLWEEAVAAKKIIDANSVIIHDFHNCFNPVSLYIGIIQRGLGAVADIPNEESMIPLAAHMRRLQDQLRNIDDVMEMVSRNRNTMMQEALMQPMQVATANTNHLKNVLEGVFRVSLPELHVTLALIELIFKRTLNPKIKTLEDIFLKITNKVSKTDKFVQEKIKILEGADAPALVSVASVLEEAWYFSEAERQRSEVQTAKTQLPSPDLLVHVNEYALINAVLNLLINACHAMRGGSNRVLSLQGFQDPANASYVVIEVKDTGSGIPDEHRDRIFEPSFTTKRTASDILASDVETTQPLGTGMGLYMVAEMIKKYGGKIELESEVGNGSTFRIYLHRIDPSLGVVAETAAPEGQRGRTYGQLSFEKYIDEIRELLGKWVQIDNALSLENAETRGRLLAQAAHVALLKLRYPDCQKALIAIHRQIESAYARLDFEMIEHYKRALDPSVVHYFNQLLAYANGLVSPSDYLVPLLEMPFDLPGIFYIPRSDYLRTNFTTQFAKGHGQRTVEQTADLFRESGVSNLAGAFVETFNNRLNAFSLGITLLKKIDPEAKLEALLTREFAEGSAQRTQKTVLGVLREAPEYRRILIEGSGPFHEAFLQALLYGPDNLFTTYPLWTELNDMPRSARERLGLIKPPSLQEIISRLPADKRTPPTQSP